MQETGQYWNGTAAGQHWGEPSMGGLNGNVERLISVCLSEWLRLGHSDLLCTSAHFQSWPLAWLGVIIRTPTAIEFLWNHVVWSYTYTILLGHLLRPLPQTPFNLFNGRPIIGPDLLVVSLSRSYPWNVLGIAPPCRPLFLVMGESIRSRRPYVLEDLAKVHLDFRSFRLLYRPRPSLTQWRIRLHIFANFVQVLLCCVLIQTSP